jgi:conjugative relaxase-like TrwC/TraI family protein
VRDGVYVRAKVQTTHKIGGDAASGFAAYLTSEMRGDYYLSDGGNSDDDRQSEEGQTPGGGRAGRWHGSSDALAKLGLSSDRPVERSELLTLMRGVSPRTGEPIRAAGGNGTRVAGVDLTFSAPKTVSALWAVSDPYRQAQIEAAHQQAVAGAIGRVERDVEVVRSRAGGELRYERAQSVIAAEFVHTSSRLTAEQEQRGVPDPQLHSHMVVLAAERTDGRFAAVESRELFRSARANGAWYRSALAYHLAQLGLQVQGGTGRDARYFELKGVPAELAERWSARSAVIDKAAREFREHYGRDPKAGELGSLTVATRGTKTIATPTNVKAAWQAVGSEHGLSHTHAESLFTALERAETRQAAPDLAAFGQDLLVDLTRSSSMVTERDLQARAYELAAGIAHPHEAQQVLADLGHTGELVELHGGMWTTRKLREREQHTVELAASRAQDRTTPVEPATLKQAERETERDLGAPLSAEQREALGTITGHGGITVLVGQAGTGKGVVLSAATDAWRQEGYRVIGTAIAGATAQRLQADANLNRVATTDSLIARAKNGSLTLNQNTVVVMDEAGMADTNRLADLAELTAGAQSKLVLVGDSAQLSPIGAGGLFKELEHNAPNAELIEVHRAQHQWEREAWAQVRGGQAATALAAYQAHDRLHITETREQAAQQIVVAWDKSRQEHPADRTVILTDASNQELDRINTLAQDRRAQNGELGNNRVPLPGRPYQLAPGDQIIFSAAHYQPGQQRVENGTLATILDGKDTTLEVHTGEPTPRDISVDIREFSDLKLAYAQHVYNAQGRTVEHSHVLIGGWQTSRENAYVALTRAREQTDIYATREDLGQQDLDPEAIGRLANAMAESRAQQASIARPAANTDQTTADRTRSEPASERGWTPHGLDRESEAARAMRDTPSQQLDRDPGRTE